MSSKPVVLLCVVFLGVGCGQRGDPVAGQGDPSPEPVVEQRIPLRNLYATTGQPDVRPVRLGPTELHQPEVKNVLTRTRRSGGPYLVLVKGRVIEDVLKASLDNLAWGYPSYRIIDSTDSDNKPDCWLVAYLGHGGKDSQTWRVRSVTRTSYRVSLVVEERDTAGMDEAHPYLAWVPLGPLDFGTYALELVNADTRQVDYLQRAVVGWHGDDIPKVKELPLPALHSVGRESIVCSVRQREPRWSAFQQRLLDDDASKCPNLFLVEAESVAEAMAAARGPLYASQPTRNYVRQSSNMQDWLVAYVGIGSSSPAWLAHSVDVGPSAIRLRAGRERSMIGTDDTVPYVFLAPLGHLSDGNYRLEVFDPSREHVTMMRRVRRVSLD